MNTLPTVCLFLCGVGLVSPAVAAPASSTAAAPAVDGRIRLNTVGATPVALKHVTVAAPEAREFRVVRVEDGAVVLSGQFGAEQRTAPGDTDEALRVADLSKVNAPGSYRVEVPGVGNSAPFKVAADVWNTPYHLVTRGLYLWRCGSPSGVSAEWQGHTYHSGPCHLQDGWLDYVDGGHTRKDSTRGWHDAGDYNKYVVNAGVSVGLIFKAWEHFRPRIERVALQIPESGNGTPDLINELRWEFDWLFTMQAEDGRVYHKLTAKNFSYWGPADKDPSERFFSPWGSTATADFVAMMAMGARHFREFDAAYADRCLAAARKSWAYLAAHPENVAPNQKMFSTGGYGVPDTVHRLWAAAELWATTREPELLKEFERRAAQVEFSFQGPTWGDVHDLALGTYLETDSAERDPALVARLRKSLLAQAEKIVQTAQQHPYGRALGGEKDAWFWGANGSVAAQTFLLHLADRLQPDARYRQAAEVTLGSLFGRNYHGRSYVTGLGHLPPIHPHDRRGEPAWPGYLVGGGHPTGRSWVDEKADYRQNEIALNWNASLTYALAAFVEPEKK